MDAKLYRYPETNASATTSNNNDRLSVVSLTAEYYLKENPSKKYSETKDNDGDGFAGVNIKIPAGFYCLKAESKHRCDYFNFNEPLSNP